MTRLEIAVTMLAAHVSKPTSGPVDERTIKGALEVADALLRQNAELTAIDLENKKEEWRAQEVAATARRQVDGELAEIRPISTGVPPGPPGHGVALGPIEKLYGYFFTPK